MRFPFSPENLRSKFIIGLKITFVFLSLHFGLIFNEQLGTYTLYGSSRSDDRYQDAYVATFNAESSNKKRCERMDQTLTELYEQRIQYECRRGPYAPYKFMFQPFSLKAEFWKLFQH